jgi:rsbT co-antagonist protein RsbR
MSAATDANAGASTGASTGKLLQTLLSQRAASIMADWHERLLRVGGNYLRGLTPAHEQQAEMAALLGGLGEALGAADERFDGDPRHPLALALHQASQLRAARGFTPEESLLFLQSCKQALMAALQAETGFGGDASMATAHAATLRIEHVLDRCVLLLMSSFMAARDEAARRQGEALREVSTPVITLWDSMLLLPLVGVVDSVRAQQIAERLLEAIGQSEAEVTLIDVTGVPVMDTGVARHILKTVAAAEMLGTRVILTGISPTTAQTMVKLGIDLSGVPTRGSLKSGVALAMAMTGRRVVAANGTAR